mgnify:FL=1
MNPQDFAEFAWAAKCTATDRAGCCLEIRADGRCVASDGHRVHLSAPTSLCAMILPTVIARIVVGWGEGTELLPVRPGEIKIVPPPSGYSGSVGVLHLSRCTLTMPSVDQVIPQGEDTAWVDPKDVRAWCKTTPTPVDGIEHDSKMGWPLATLRPCKGLDGALGRVPPIGLNPGYLADAIVGARGAIGLCHSGDLCSPLRLSIVRGDLGTRLAVIMPCRL